MRIDLLGAEFNIKTDQDPEYLKQVVELYRQKVEEVRGSVQTSDALKIAILAGILTADQHLKSTRSSHTDTEEAERIAGTLIQELEEVLNGETEGAPDLPSDAI